MPSSDWRPAEAEKSLRRILPHVESACAAALDAQPEEWEKFKNRLNREWTRLFICLHQLYGWQYDFFYTIERILSSMVRSWIDRPPALKSLDDRRTADPRWFLSEDMVGAVLYVDLFSDNLANLNHNIGYFKKLGLTYLHLMPIFAAPRGDSDGGYAVSDYRSINPDIGSMAELAELSERLRAEGIALALDFVLNHTSDEHLWARKARTGNPDFLNYYFTYPDRELPDQFQKYLRDIFPAVRRGSFTWKQEMGRWVWTTFNSFQWDLNYGNPEVLRAMAEEMFFLANQGVEVFRLDAVPFIWKRMGTDCENQPEAHVIIEAFNAMMKITAPAVLFKSEAIVHPDEVVRYIHPDKCQLSYNPMLMALLWEALATRDATFLKASVRRRARIPDGCAWVNYLRCHDDIGWTFDDDEARHLGVDPAGHRKFLNDFYTGQHPGSFARGMPFQFNPDTGDLRISGTLSSLAGLEAAVEKADDDLIQAAVRRINLLRNVMTTAAGFPLLYIGDEWGMLNDYTFLTDPAKAGDTRWVHRSRKRWEAGEDLSHAGTLEWRFFHEMTRLFKMRKSLPVFRNGDMDVVRTGNRHLFGYVRANGDRRVLIVNNFSEHPQTMAARFLRACGAQGDISDLYANETVFGENDLTLDGYRFVWLDVSNHGDS